MSESGASKPPSGGSQADGSSAWQNIKAHVKDFVEASPEEHKE
jgi:hypothetical protein|eukprot:CAMPEP_0177769836 /NCGR_PEP_ID=MMETSP0491_2-20121128/10569_1 /TAXON_ID=63592 /ORGANISM="Tetraselmis chuii, Strain PLY429" /LENGTH=42 /DNA_ID= /DNA_START= /DNA_END= /DNA_ORIENTATION=